MLCLLIFFSHWHSNPPKDLQLSRITGHRQGRVNHEDRRDGGTGLIGSKTVAILRQGGHEVVAASPKSGIKSSA
jgi:hypothetical protein